MNKSHREIYDWDSKSPWKYRSRTEAKSPFDVRAINEIKWYFFDKKRAHTGKKKAALFRGEQARWTVVRHSDGFHSVESKRISPSTPSSLGWYWRRAYHMSLLCSSYERWTRTRCERRDIISKLYDNRPFLTLHGVSALSAKYVKDN